MKNYYYDDRRWFLGKWIFYWIERALFQQMGTKTDSLYKQFGMWIPAQVQSMSGILLSWLTMNLVGAAACSAQLVGE